MCRRPDIVIWRTRNRTHLIRWCRSELAVFLLLVVRKLLIWLAFKRSTTPVFLHKNLFCFFSWNSFVQHVLGCQAAAEQNAERLGFPFFKHTFRKSRFHSKPSTHQGYRSLSQWIRETTPRLHGESLLLQFWRPITILVCWSGGGVEDILIA